MLSDYKFLNHSPLMAVALAIVTLLILMLPSLATSTSESLPVLVQPEASPANPAEPTSADSRPPEFDALAGLVGHAEAWHLVHGNRLGPQTAGETSTPQVRLATVHPASDTLTHTAFLPLVVRHEVLPMVERRAIWITRYDWTQFGVAPTPESLDAMVEKIAAAGFNTLFFQVRASGDAYYTPGLEPWAARLSSGPVSETLGLDPGWDPLARMIALGQASGIEVHAYVNVYTAWLSPPASQGAPWPRATTPPQMFDWFTYGPLNTAHPGYHGLGFEWRQYSQTDVPMLLQENTYLWATPGRDEVNAHVAAVIRDIVTRYPVDGVHLDLVRYAGPGYSYDPASNAAAGEAKSPTRDQWQRDRITVLVRQVHAEAEALRPGIMVSAAVWPIYINEWNFQVEGVTATSGYNDYYQDSKGWLVNGEVDALLPMLYGSIPDETANWETLVQDFLDDSQGKPVYPGIGTHYADFEAIAWRIETARRMGAQGHALFSYGGLNTQGYWDELTSGPYRIPAILP